MKKIIALSGASGNMGVETLIQLMQSDCVETVRVLLTEDKKSKAFHRKNKKRYGDKFQAVFGDIANLDDVRRFVGDADYVLNLAAVIPPLSDHYPTLADRCNRIGTENVVKAVEEKEHQPKLVHISSVAVYGNRNYLHPWGRVGDPLLPSVYDSYAATKVKGEYSVLESNVLNWVVLRQTGILHDKMLMNNMSDGLMFHTSYNVPIEWVTARDSGLLIRRIIERDVRGEIDGFWRKCYNIGGGAPNRCTGYDTFDAGFKLIGGSTEQFMRPTWNSLRNFHCMWFYDSDELEKLFDFQHETIPEFWKNLLKKNEYYRLAKLLPPSLISKLAIQRLLGDDNAPYEWIKSGDAGKVKAYFGSKENIECCPTDWKNYAVLAKGELPDETIDYDALKSIENAKLLSHGYDERKPDSELDIEDMREAAAFRGGECLSQTMVKGDLYTRLLWKCHDGHEFYAIPYTVLKAGHWCPKCCHPEPWDYDRLAKFMPFYAQVWYDTHAKEENTRYYFNAGHRAKYSLIRTEETL